MDISNEIFEIGQHRNYFFRKNFSKKKKTDPE